jgi:hypothetical protein
MAATVYILGALITLLCAVLLLRAYGAVKQRLLLWSGLCFVGLTVSNVLLFVDLVMLPPDVNLHVARLATAAISMSVLLYGLIWEGE